MPNARSLSSGSHSVRSLPLRPNLESLQKQAKRLLKEWRDDVPDARKFATSFHPKPEAFSRLRDAQLAIARSYGHLDWEALSEAVEQARLLHLEHEERAREFLKYAVLHFEGQPDRPWRRTRAERILATSPELAEANVFTAAATGHLAALKKFIEKDPAAATAKDPVRGWSPLLHVCFGRVLLQKDADPVGCARLLLQKGADPADRFFSYGKYRYTAITGAVGEGESGPENVPPHPNARELVELLLDHGADPNDGQSLYNTCFRQGDEWMELFLSRGLKQGQMCNWEDGYTTSTIDFQLCAAVRRGFIERVKLLLAHNADPDALDFYNERPAYVNALRDGHQEIATLLKAAGATSKLEPEDEIRIAVRQGDRARAQRLIQEHPELIANVRSFVELAEGGNVTAVQLLLELGADVHGQMPGGATALHRAAIAGHRDIVLLLLEHGARIDQIEDNYGGTAIGWAQAGGHIALRDELLDRTEDIFDLCYYGRVEQVEALLTRAPSLVEKVDRDGDTPLHCIGPSTPRAEEMIDLLLARGASLVAKNNKGETPFARQKELEDDSIAALLSKRMKAE